MIDRVEASVHIVGCRARLRQEVPVDYVERGSLCAVCLSVRMPLLAEKVGAGSSGEAAPPLPSSSFGGRSQTPMHAIPPQRTANAPVPRPKRDLFTPRQPL